MYHCDNTSGWLPFSFMYVRGERTISKREEVYHETESRMRVHYGTERTRLDYGTKKMRVHYETRNCTFNFSLALAL